MESNIADVIISNCVINLSPDKRKTFAEIRRMLKPGGRLVISDICYDEDIPLAIKYNQRSRVTRIPYGDQAIYIRRDYFAKMGGYKEIPFLEDVDLMRRIKQDRQRIRILKDPVLTSARRWETEGMLYTSFRNRIVMLLYYLGVSPEKLSRLYRSQGAPKRLDT